MAKEAKSHFLGHRERLRQRFRESGCNIKSISEYELVELILYRSHERADVKPIAKKLLKHFGSFAELINAERKELMEIEGVGERAADEILIIHAALTHALHQKLFNKPLLSSWQDLFYYCQQNIGYKPVECLHIFFLNTKHYLIEDTMLHEGSVNRASIFPREVLRLAINYNASSVVLAHNHPSGDHEPSREDIILTREIATILKAADIKLHDHIIVSRGQVSSFQQLNLFRDLNP